MILLCATNSGGFFEFRCEARKCEEVYKNRTERRSGRPTSPVINVQVELFTPYREPPLQSSSKSHRWIPVFMWRPFVAPANERLDTFTSVLTTTSSSSGDSIGELKDTSRKLNTR